MFHRRRVRLLGNKFAQVYCVCIVFMACNAFAAGSLDSRYGNNGVTRFLLPSTGSSITDMVMLPDDRVIVGGSALNTQTTLALARFNKQGQLDLTFGNGNGYVNYASPTLPIAAIEGFSVDSTYNIYAVGHGRHLSDNAYAFKLSVAGAIDTSFANAGVYLHSTHPRLPAGVDTIFKAVAVQPDNKVLIIGKSESSLGIHRGAFILRLLPDGSPDSSFGTSADGLVFFGQFPIPASSIASTNAESIKVLDSGEIVVGGFLQNAGWGGFVLRFTANGLLDSSFHNSSGIYLLTVSGWSGFIEVDHSGNVYLLSRVIGPGSNVFDRCLVSKLDYNGQVDSSYGLGGHAMLIPPAGDFYNCGSIAAGSHGGMAIAVMDRYPVQGATYNGPAKILRLDKHGQLITSFGNQGVASVWTPHIINSTYLTDLFNHTFVEAQSDGKLVFVIGEYRANGVGYTVGRIKDDGNHFMVAPNGFVHKDMQPANTWITSNIVQIQNLDTSVSIVVEIDNGEYSINGQAYTSAPGWVRNGDLITVRNRTGQGANFIATTTLTLGGDKDRKNAGMLRGYQQSLAFIIAIGPIAMDSVDPELSPLLPSP